MWEMLVYEKDYSATITNVEDVLNGLASGTGGFPLVTEDDFLFVWTFDHGGPGPGQPDPACFRLLDGGKIYNYEFVFQCYQVFPPGNLYTINFPSSTKKNLPYIINFD